MLREYPDGRLDILTLGRRRFEIVRLNEERSFLRGSVEFFDDEDGSRGPRGRRFRARAIEGYNELQALTSEAPLPASRRERSAAELPAGATGAGSGSPADAARHPQRSRPPAATGGIPAGVPDPPAPRCST